MIDKRTKAYKQGFRDGFEARSKALELFQPVRVCPVCDGNKYVVYGFYPFQQKQNCQYCLRRGYVSQ